MIAIVFPQQDGKMADKQAPLIMEEVTDPEELAKAQAQRQRFDRNSAWLQAHATEVYACYRGKCVVIAGEELFAADTPEEAWALATAAHPEDDGSFIRYIPREKVARIYANQWRVVAV
jgi:hypothetical protein